MQTWNTVAQVRWFGLFPCCSVYNLARSGPSRFLIASGRHGAAAQAPLAPAADDGGGLAALGGEYLLVAEEDGDALSSFSGEDAWQSAHEDDMQALDGLPAGYHACPGFPELAFRMQGNTKIVFVATALDTPHIGKIAYTTKPGDYLPSSVQVAWHTLALCHSLLCSLSK